jgi:hypothetical protein
MYIGFKLLASLGIFKIRHRHLSARRYYEKLTAEAATTIIVGHVDQAKTAEAGSSLGFRNIVWRLLSLTPRDISRFNKFHLGEHINIDFELNAKLNEVFTEASRIAPSFISDEARMAWPLVHRLILLYSATGPTCFFSILPSSGANRMDFLRVL